MNPKKIVHYCIVQSITPEHLMRYVEEKIRMGWEPLGSLVVNTGGSGTTNFYQSMIKYSEGN